MKPRLNSRWPARLTALLGVFSSLQGMARSETQEVTIHQGLNYVGLHVAGPVVSQGAITASSSAVLTISGDTPADISESYSIECAGGFWAPCVSWQSGEHKVTVRLLEGETAPAAGQQYIIRRALRIPELLGSGSSVQLAGGTVDEADVIRLRHKGAWRTLHFSGGPDGEWMLAGSPRPGARVPVYFPQVLVIERQSAVPLTLKFSGAARTWPVIVSLDDPLLQWTTDEDENRTIVAAPGSGTALSDSGLASGSGASWSALTGAADAKEADALLLPQKGGALQALHLNAEGVWSGSGSLTLPGAVIIERRSSPLIQRVRLLP